MVINARTQTSPTIAYLALVLQVRQAVFRKTPSPKRVEERIPAVLPIADPDAKAVSVTRVT